MVLWFDRNQEESCERAFLEIERLVRFLLYKPSRLLSSLFAWHLLKIRFDPMRSAKGVNHLDRSSPLIVKVVRKASWRVQTASIVLRRPLC